MKSEAPKTALASPSLFAGQGTEHKQSVRPFYETVPMIGESFDEQVTPQIDEISSRDEEIPDLEVVPPIPKMQSRYKTGQYILSMNDQAIYIVKGSIENVVEKTMKMVLFSVDEKRKITVDMTDPNYQVASADNAIWSVSKGVDAIVASNLKTSVMMTTKSAIEEFAQKFSQTTTFLNVGNAQSYVFQQLVEIICEVIQGSRFPEDFLILRSPFVPFDKRFQVDAKAGADILSMSQYDLSFKNEILSTNLSLFANAQFTMESTGHFFVGGGTVGGVDIKLLKDLSDHLPFSQNMKEKLYKKMIAIFETANGLGPAAVALYQIQIPNELLEQLVYISQAGGKTLDSHTSILQSTLEGLKRVGELFQDIEMVEFASKEPTMEDKKYFDTFNSYVFKASQFPGFWQNNWKISPQARVIMNPQYFLDSRQGIKFKLHQSDKLKQQTEFSQELLEIKFELLKTQISEDGLLKEEKYQAILDQKDILPLENIIDMLWDVYSRDSLSVPARLKLDFMEKSIQEDIDKIYFIPVYKKDNLKSLLNSIISFFDENHYSILERIRRLTNYRNYIYKRACHEAGQLIFNILHVRFQDYKKHFLLEDNANFYNVYLRAEIYYQNILKVIQLQNTINQSKNQKKIDKMKKIIADEKISIENVIDCLKRLVK